MSGKQTPMGRMDHGKTECGRIVMSRWDQPERSDNEADRQRFIRDVQRSGFIHSTQVRYEGDKMPDWVGQDNASLTIKNLPPQLMNQLNRAAEA